MIWVTSHTCSKHRELLGFVLNPNFIIYNLTINQPKKEDSILILFHMGFTNPIFMNSKVKMQFYQNPSFWRQAINHTRHLKLSRSTLRFSFHTFLASLLLPLLLLLLFLFLSAFALLSLPSVFELPPPPKLGTNLAFKSRFC